MILKTNRLSINSTHRTSTKFMIHGYNSCKTFQEMLILENDTFVVLLKKKSIRNSMGDG